MLTVESTVSTLEVTLNAHKKEPGILILIFRSQDDPTATRLAHKTKVTKAF